MTDTATRSPDRAKEDDNRRICDFCGEARALLACRADSAKLCLSCDREVHSTNQLFTKHARSLLCNACDSCPASIFCSTETLALCQNCDWECHDQSLSSLHDRRPLEGFRGCPCVNELLSYLGFEDLNKKALLGGGGDDYGDFGLEGAMVGYSDLLVWDTPTIVTLDDLISSNSNGSQNTFQAMGVPPLPKNRKAACGKYKEELLNQLREMAKSEPALIDGHKDTESMTQIQFSVPQQDLLSRDTIIEFGDGVELHEIPPYKGGSLWCTDNAEFANRCPPSKLQGICSQDSLLVPDKDSDVNGNSSLVNYGHNGKSIDHVITGCSQVLPKFIPRELTSQERDSAILRYKEKKRTRRYDKHIRYESRRMRAESRTRIKGRFGKIENQIIGL